MARTSEYSEVYAQQYGVPADILDGAAYAGEYYDPIMVEKAAIELRSAYDATGNWNKAVEQYALRNYGGQAQHYAKVIKETGGLSSGTIGKEPQGNFGGYGDALENAGGKLSEIFAGGFAVVFGAALIILALLSIKPVREVAVSTVTGGK